MWKVALGVAVLLQAGTLRAGEADEEAAVRVECPAEDSSTRDCTADEVPVTETPPQDPTKPAEPAAHTATAPTPAVTAPARSAFATVSFRNDVGKKLRLVEAHFTMDGAVVPTRLTNAERGKSYVVLSGSVLPGPHVVTARLTYQGDRGVFSYMKGYKLNVRSAQVLTTPENRPVSFTLVGAENAGMNVPLEKRVVVKVEEGAR